MNQKTFTIEPLKKASTALSAAIKDLKGKNYPYDYMRDATIQRFEFTFELSWKSLNRFFKINQNPSINNLKNIFREAGKSGLIKSVEQWFEFHRARNMASHTYNEKVAEEVVQHAVAFEKEVIELIKNLENAID